MKVSSNSRVFVTGGAGYVGSHMVKALHQQGFRVTVFDNLSTGNKRALQWGDFVAGDLLDQEKITNALKTCAPDFIMHFAARTLVGESVTNPGLYYRNNVVGSFNLLEARNLVCPHVPILFSSTCSVHKESSTPISELSEIGPINPYAKTKWMVENMLADYQVAFGSGYAVLRYFNASGCDIEGLLGERHEPESHLIPRLLRHLILPEKNPMAVFGDDYPTRDGTCVRDYVHVEDLVQGHLLAMENLLNTGKSTVFNFGTSRGYTVKEVISAVERATGREIKLHVQARRAGDPPQLTANSEKARSQLGWKPKYDLDQIVESAWRWFSKSYPW